MSRKENVDIRNLKNYMYTTIKNSKLNEEDIDMLMGLAQNFISIYTCAVYEKYGFINL